MRAAMNTRYGPAGVVDIVDTAAPEPGPGEVLVRVVCSTVTRTDCGFRTAHPWFIRFFSGVRAPRYPILGSDFAGVVTALGPGADAFEVGDRVFGSSEDRFGTHAEYVAINESEAVAPIPEGIGDEAAAASTEASHYALASLRAAGVRREHSVMVYGATGAIGTAAVQLLHGRGVRVTAVCDTPRIALVEGLGADRVIDYTATDFTADSERFDIVFDAVGKSTFGACRKLLKPKGVYASTDLGPYAQNPLLGLATLASPGRRAMLPLPPKRDRRFIDLIAAELASGRFRPVIDRSYPLQEIRQAYEYVESGQKTGNVIIRIADEV